MKKDLPWLRLVLTTSGIRDIRAANWATVAVKNRLIDEDFKNLGWNWLKFYPSMTSHTSHPANQYFGHAELAFFFSPVGRNAHDDWLRPTVISPWLRSVLHIICTGRVIGRSDIAILRIDVARNAVLALLLRASRIVLIRIDLQADLNRFRCLSIV